MKQLDPRAVWLFFINSLFGWFFMLIFFGWVVIPAFMTLSRDGMIGEYVTTGLMAVGLLVIVLLALSYIIAKLSYYYYRYELTDIVFKKEHGIIWKKYVSIPYDRIQNVDIYRGVFARLLGLSDVQIQTAGGITAGSYGAFSEGRLPGLSKEDAEKLRDELLQRARSSRSGQGL